MFSFSTGPHKSLTWLVLKRGSHRLECVPGILVRAAGKKGQLTEGGLERGWVEERGRDWVRMGREGAILKSLGWGG